jgi:hypothetical protein
MRQVGYLPELYEGTWTKKYKKFPKSLLLEPQKLSAWVTCSLEAAMIVEV